MYNAFFLGDFDVTSLIFGSFVLFFIGLVIYLRREDRREGYPLEDDVSGRLEAAGGLFFAAQPKTFIRPHGEGPVTKPNNQRESQDVNAHRSSRAPGSPLIPNGDPLLAGVGPGAYAQRQRRPDVLLHGAAKIVPLRVASDFWVDKKDPDPRGFRVIGADGREAGVVSDLWIDRGEYMIRYIEVELAAAPGTAARRVLAPMPMAVFNKARRSVRIDALLASQFASAPTLESPDQITFDEEERVAAYFGGGTLYATPQRSEPLL